MPTTITTDRSKQVFWNARRANDQSITLHFVVSAVDFDISTYTFTAGVYRQNSDTAIISLTQGSGLTNGGANGELVITFTDTQLTVNPDEYFIRVAYSVGGLNYLLLNGTFKVNDSYFDGTVTTSQTIAVTIGDVEVTMEVTLLSGGSGLTLGETSTTAYRGDRGKTAYDHSQLVTGNPHNVTAAQTGADPAGSALAAQVAAQAYADSLVVGLWDDRGNFDASVNAYPSSGGSGTAGAIKKGDIWTVSVGGTLPTALVVVAGDTVRALVDTPGNTQANWAIAENNIGYVPENQANKATTFGTINDTLYPSVEAVTEYAVAITNTAVALTDGASITLTATKHTLTTDEVAVTITDSYAGDFLGIEVILSGITATTWTLPANSLGAYNGEASGTNTIVITGAVAGDRIVISRWKCGSNYSWVAFNMGQ